MVAVVAQKRTPCVLSMHHFRRYFPDESVLVKEPQAKRERVGFQIPEFMLFQNTSGFPSYSVCGRAFVFGILTQENPDLTFISMRVWKFMVPP